MQFDVLIVGGGHGGAHAALALLQRNFAGSIAIVGEESILPYERPPLSKEYLSGQKPADKLMIRPPAYWAERGVTMLTGCRIVAVDPERHEVTGDDGRRISYGSLVWATGGKARRLGCLGDNLANVHAIRTIPDVDRLSRDLETADRVCVIGAGYVGLEAAAVLRGLGKRVMVIEATERVLARVAGRSLSDFYRAEHEARGVEFLFSARVTGAIEEDGRAVAVTLADGTSVPCDVVIVGIGIVPETEPLLEAGATGGNGVLVDENCRTSLPGIFAIGDCALHENRFAQSGPVRLESVQNATDMAAAMAASVTGAPAPYGSVPWFWSNQYDLRLQTVGLSGGHDTHVLRGTPESRSFSVLYLRDGRVRAADCVNAVKDYVAARQLVAAEAEIAPEALADTGLPLKSLLAT